MKYGIIRQEDLDMIRRILDSAQIMDGVTGPSPVPIPPPTTVGTILGTKHDTGFKWGEKSLKERKGVHPILLNVADLALTQYTTVDIGFHDGVRTITQQRNMVRDGASQTMESKHLIQRSGFGEAMDLVGYKNGEISWDWDVYYIIAYAVDLAATELGVANQIRWGGAWDRRLSDFGGSLSAYKKAVEDYKKRHAGEDFIDGPHFELVQ